jgi:hypothetical protein
MTGDGPDTTSPRRPWHPYAVLAAAVALPGMGHVLAGKPVRGLQFAFFIVLFGWLTTKIAPPEATFIGRHAGGIFVWCLSVLDAYRTARIRWETWRRGGGVT